MQSRPTILLSLVLLLGGVSLDAIAVQYARPSGTVSAGSWTYAGAGSLHEATDEVTANGDTDRCRTLADSDTMQLDLSAVSDPLTGSGHILRINLTADGAKQGESCDVQLFDGATPILASAWSVGITRGVFEQHFYTLTAAEANSIGDYSNLSVSFTSGGISTKDNDEIRVTWFEMEVPDTVAAEPEMDVFGNAVEITSGDTSPSLTDDTDFGSALVTGGTVDHTFSIVNSGTADLDLTGGTLVVVSGTHAAEFTVTADPATAVTSGGGSTTFTIRFDPAGTGLRSASVSIDNTDSDENPYTFDIQGTGTEPEMDVFGNAVEITSGDTSPSLTDDTDFGSALVTGETVDHTFSIVNSGTADLDLTGGTLVVVSGTHAAEFTVTADPATPVTSGGGSTTFTIRFDPAGTGLRSASVSIDNTDSDENPYTFDIQGTGTAAAEPEMDVFGNAVEITSGDTSPSLTDDTDFGSALVTGETVDHTFSIVNSGTADLDLTGGTLVVISGTHAAEFTVTADPSTPVTSGGGSTTFTIRFDPAGTGLRSASVSIDNTDSDENPYTFDIQGTGTAAAAPEMDVYGNGVEITSGDTSPSLTDDTDFGSALVAGGTVDHTFSITNSGTADLDLTGGTLVVVSGTHAAEFTVTADPSSPVGSGGGSTTFTIRFDPAGTGLREASVSIDNTDSDENPYTFDIQGTGTAAVPEMDVYGNGIEITSGDTSPSVTDDTDFGSAVVTGGTVDHIFSIINSGTADLDLTGGTLVVISGTHAAEFTVTADPSTPVTSGGGSTTFTIRFDPAGAGLRSASVSIDNTDSDENPYTFDIQGTGAADSPDMGVYLDGRHIADGTSALTFGDVQVLTGLVDKVFVITNVGAADLDLTGTPRVELTGADSGDFSVTVVPSTPVGIGAGTTFTIQFDPSVIGDRFATVSIPNNAPDENPYDFLIKGTGRYGHNINAGAICADCHAVSGFHFDPNEAVARGAEQEAVCKSCHNPSGSASTMTNVANHLVNDGSNIVDCGSCHEVHNSTNQSALVSFDPHSSTTATNLSWIRTDPDKYIRTEFGYDGTALATNVYHQKPQHFAFASTNSPWNGVCQSCHTTTKYHRQDNSELAENKNHEMGKDCSTCHGHDGGFAPSGGGGCLGCHSEQKGDRRPIVSDFGLTSHHVMGGSVTTGDCAVCHYESVDEDKHQNGTIELRDPDTGLALTSFTNLIREADSDFSNEPWITDVQNNFCLKCHDADGASSADVRVGTGGSALQPFSTNTRDAPNVAAQFSTGNGFFHPVLGAGDNPNCNSSTMVSPWNQDGGGDHDLISCFDCHDVNGHGGNNQRMLRQAVDFDAMEAAATKADLPTGMGLTVASLCLVCHQASVYNSGSPAAVSVFEFHQQGQHLPDTNELGCMGCHGGVKDFSGLSGGNSSVRGNIHGGSYTWTEGDASGYAVDYFMLGGWLDGWGKPGSVKGQPGIGCGGGDCNHSGGDAQGYTTRLD